MYWFSKVPLNYALITFLAFFDSVCLLVLGLELGKGGVTDNPYLWPACRPGLGSSFAWNRLIGLIRLTAFEASSAPRLQHAGVTL